MSRSSGALRLVQSAPFVTQQKGNFMKISGLGALAIGVCYAIGTLTLFRKAAELM